ncbi:hypothetical protein IT575_03020 [bacterium]|nr:hypothetical protein [bacterium]
MESKRLAADLAKVSSPLGRQLLKLSYDLATGSGENEPMLYSAPTEYGRRVRQQLRASDLAARLASPDLLPDPGAYAHPMLQSFFRGTRPISYDTLLERLVEDLEWFLKPHNSPPLPASVVAKVSATLGSTTLYGLLGGSLAALLLGKWYAVPLVAIGGLALVLNYVIMSRRQIDPGRKYEAAMELYIYLAESYSDPQEVEAMVDALNTAELEGAVVTETRAQPLESR